MKLRRYETNLRISAVGVIAFGGWNFLKTLLLILLNPQSIIDAADLSEGASGLLYIVYIIMIIAVLIDLGFRLFVGLSARKEANGKKKSIAYLIITVLLIIFSLIGLVSVIASLGSSSTFDTIVMLIVEATSLYASLELFVSAILVRRLRKEPSAEGV